MHCKAATPCGCSLRPSARKACAAVAAGNHAPTFVHPAKGALSNALQQLHLLGGALLRGGVCVRAALRGSSLIYGAGLRRARAGRCAHHRHKQHM